MRGLRVFTFLALLPFRSLSGQAVPTATTTVFTGSIAGTVQAADGKGVSKIPVAIRVRPAAAGTKFTTFNADVSTDKDGGFTVSGVPDGTYAVCPLPAAGNLLPACDWGAEPTVSVANGKAATMKPIVLQAGADLWVHVDDPQGKRSSTEGKVPGAVLFLRVHPAGGRAISIPLTSSSGNGFEHHVLVPPATDLVMNAYSNSYTISNSAGTISTPATSSRGYSITFNIPTGTAQHKETISVR
jgi:hypothetical protein